MQISLNTTYYFSKHNIIFHNKLKIIFEVSNKEMFINLNLKNMYLPYNFYKKNLNIKNHWKLLNNLKTQIFDIITNSV